MRPGLLAAGMRVPHSYLHRRCSDYVSSCQRAFLCTNSILCCLLLCSRLGRRRTLRGPCCSFLLCSVLSAWIYVLAASLAASFFGLCRGRVSACVCCAVFLRRISHAASCCVLFPARAASLYLRCSAGDWPHAAKKAGKQTATSTSVPTYSAARETRALHRFARKGR